MHSCGRRRMVLVAMVCLLMLGWTPPSRAQWQSLSGAGMLVFDPAAVSKLIVEIKLMLQNLQQTGWAGEEVERLMRTLDEVVAVEHALHYQLPNLDPLLQERYPGYQYDTSTFWWPNVEQWSYTGLNTMRGALDTVHEQLRPEQRMHEEQVLAALKAQTEAAAGNLDVSQTGNMIGLQVAQELRKLRQMVGAQTNALTVAQAHEIHLKAVSERVAHDLLANSPSEVPTAADGNSFTLLGPTR